MASGIWRRGPEPPVEGQGGWPLKLKAFEHYFAGVKRRSMAHPRMVNYETWTQHLSFSFSTWSCKTLTQI